MLGSFVPLFMHKIILFTKNLSLVSVPGASNEAVFHGWHFNITTNTLNLWPNRTTDYKSRMSRVLSSLLIINDIVMVENFVNSVIFSF